MNRSLLASSLSLLALVACGGGVADENATRTHAELDGFLRNDSPSQAVPTLAKLGPSCRQDFFICENFTNATTSSTCTPTSHCLVEKFEPAIITNSGRVHAVGYFEPMAACTPTRKGSNADETCRTIDVFVPTEMTP